MRLPAIYYLHYSRGQKKEMTLIIPLLPSYHMLRSHQEVDLAMLSPSQAAT